MIPTTTGWYWGTYNSQIHLGLVRVLRNTTSVYINRTDVDLQDVAWIAIPEEFQEAVGSSMDAMDAWAMQPVVEAIAANDWETARDRVAAARVELRRFGKQMASGCWGRLD